MGVQWVFKLNFYYGAEESGEKASADGSRMKSKIGVDGQ